MEAFYGILIPFLGTSLGAACVFFLKNAQRRGAARADRLCRGRDGGGERMEPADPGHCAVGGAGPVVVSPGGAGVLGRHFVFAGAGPHHSASAREKPKSRLQRTTMMVLDVALG